MGSPLLRVEDLHAFYTVPLGGVGFGYRRVWALRGVNLDVFPGTTLGIVGGSGSGKTTLIRTVLGFLKPAKGRILFRGVDLSKLGSKRREVAREMGYVPQEPSQSINPKMAVKDSIAEPLRPLRLSEEDIEKRVGVVMEMLDLDLSIGRMLARELSGGMLQRVAIARAIISKPKLVLLDEPTSFLDISTQAQILNILRDLKEELGLTYVIVSHDIDVVSYISDRIAVMVSGRVIEEGVAEDVLREPLHPYTSILLNPEGVTKEISIVNSETDLCPIRSWCPWKAEKCLSKPPPVVAVSKERTVLCWYFAD
jgi:ABC-type glutathione transport system ATPase component